MVFENLPDNCFEHNSFKYLGFFFSNIHGGLTQLNLTIQLNYQNNLRESSHPLDLLSMPNNVYTVA